MKKFIYLLAVVFLNCGLRAQTSWTNFYSGPVQGDDTVTALAADASDNVYAAGQSAGASNSLDYATVKFSPSGTMLWSARYAGAPGFKAKPTAIGVDSSANVFVTGYAQHNGSGSDFVTIKYSTAGAPLWTNIYNGPGNGTDEAYALAVDSGNNVYVAGTVTNTGGVSNLGLIKYSNSGSVLWTVLFNRFGTNGSSGLALQLDPGGNAIVSGYTMDNSFNDYILTVKFSSAGTPIWTNLCYNPFAYNDVPAAFLAVDINSNVIVSGYSYSVATMDDFVTLKYSGAGAPVWTNRYDDATHANDYPAGVAVDRAGNAYVTGPVTIKYSSAGTPVWTNKYDVSDGVANAIAVDSHNNVVVTGYSYDDDGFADFLTLEYSGTGSMVVSNRYSQASNDDDEYVYALALDNRDDAIVGGLGSIFTFSPPLSDFVVIDYAAAATAPYFSLLTAPGSGFGFSNKLFGFSLSGPAGSNAVVQYSTNLTTWVPLKTNNLGLGVTNFSDPQSATNRRRFYRALLTP